MDRPDDARAALEAAFTRLPGDVDVVYALAVFHAQRGETEPMRRYVALLRERGDPRASAFPE
jgi:hypothetical protein